MRLSQLTIQPIQSLKGIHVSQAKCHLFGLEWDSVLVVTKSDGTRLNTQHLKRLKALDVMLTPNGIALKTPLNQSLEILTNEFTSYQPTQNFPKKLFVDELFLEEFYLTQVASIRTNRFLSDYLQEDVQIHWREPQHLKKRSGQLLSRLKSPFYLINLASVRHLSEQTGYPFSENDFGANLIIDQTLPFAEDGWKTIQIGEVNFELIHPKKFIHHSDFKQATDSNSAFKALSQLRCDEQHNIEFGYYLKPQNTGVLKLNDGINVQQTRTVKKYLVQTNLRPKKNTITIEMDGKTLAGNCEEPLLDQLERANIIVPNSCRAAVCGRCRLTLLEGEVKEINQSNARRHSLIKNQRRIFACSTIPLTNVTLTKDKK